MSRLPELGPPRLRELLWFDLTQGLPTAAAVLREHLGTMELAKALVCYLGRDLFTRPLRAVPAGTLPADRERLSRRQFRSVLILDDVLRRDLGIDSDRALFILRDVVGRAGDLFIATNFPPLVIQAWPQVEPAERERFAQQASGRFFNAETEIQSVDSDSLHFRILSCRFVELSRAVGRPYLAPLFCHADAVHFGQPGRPSLFRPETLAEGGSCCDFHISYATRDEADPE